MRDRHLGAEEGGNRELAVAEGDYGVEAVRCRGCLGGGDLQAKRSSIGTSAKARGASLGERNGIGHGNVSHAARGRRGF